MSKKVLAIVSSPRKGGRKAKGELYGTALYCMSYFKRPGWKD